MKKWLIIILLIGLAGFTEGQNETNPCINGWNNESVGWTCVFMSASGNENFGIDLCEAHNSTCVYYPQNETLPLNITTDYIIKIVPQRIDNSSDFREYWINTTPMNNLIMLFLLIVVMLILVKIILYK